MLQQTQVSTVLRYYAPFLARFPTVSDLARAALEEVLALWSGLGYYSRARNLHACARAVCELHGGSFPTDRAVLESLPGIGPSTAAAVAAFSVGQRVSILDGNVKRVLARHRAFGQDLARPAGLRALWAMADALLPTQGEIEAYTQGMMDLGATVCVQRRPRCGVCPVAADCMARVQCSLQDYPVKSARLGRGRRTSVLLMALQPHGAVLMQRRPPRGVWGGLWALPEFIDEPHLWRALAAGGLPRELQVEALPTVRHALTHLDWVLQPRRLLVSESAMAGPLIAAVAQALGLTSKSADPSVGNPVLSWMDLGIALDCGLPAPIRVLLKEQAQRLQDPERGVGP